MDDGRAVPLDRVTGFRRGLIVVAQLPFAVSRSEPSSLPGRASATARFFPRHLGERVRDRHARSDETVRLLMTAPGVGTIVAMGYVTGIETPARFSHSSSVGAYFGMTPKRYQSGEVDKAGRVSKCGDGMVRGLLFEAAKVLLSRSAKPSDLQAWGRALAKRIGSKKATMAVARKLAVILHRMWTTGEPFRWTASPASAAA